MLFMVFGKSLFKNIVYGINDDIIVDFDCIFLVVFCMINVIIFVFVVIDEVYGVVKGYVEIVYFFMND